MTYARGSLQDRFWKYVTKGDVCWLWHGYKNNMGYGRISVSGSRKMRFSHRVSWELHKGPIPKGMCVLHRCDTPACMRPDHLFIGTRSDNSLDMARKGRAGQRGINGTHAKLVECEVMKIRHACKGMKQSEIAALFGVTQVTVSQIRSRASWGYLP